jgi:hypothetical protein
MYRRLGLRRNGRYVRGVILYAVVIHQKCKNVFPG